MDLARPLTLITPTVDGDVLAVLAGATASFTGRQVHQVAGRHSERGVRNALHRLSEQGIVTRQRVGAHNQYTLNRTHIAAPYIEALVRLRTELLQRIRAELENWKVQAEFASLFGSAVQGPMRPDSDIDLFVVRPTGVDVGDPWLEQLSSLAEAVTSWTGNDTRLLELSAEELREGLAAGEPVLVSIRDEGVPLCGSNSYLHLLGRSEYKAGSRGGA